MSGPTSKCTDTGRQTQLHRETNVFNIRDTHNIKQTGMQTLTWRSDRAFFMEAVPLKATTMVLSLHPIRHRVSSCSSQNSSLSVRLYSPRAVRRFRVVLSG